MKSIRRILLVGLVALAVAGLDPIPASAAELKVVTLGDAGDGTCDTTCTLRDAVDDANETAVLDTIVFDIPETPIALTSALPGITDPVVIDGFSDPGSERVELDGSAVVGTADGLRFSTGDDSTVKGLVINGFSDDGIDFQANAQGNRAEGNYIGTNLAGTAADPNVANGIHVQGPNNVIGGSTAAARNVISGNGSNGVRIAGTGTTGNRIEGNYIGTNAAGTGAVPNSANGIVVTTDADNNAIGGTNAGLRNVISGNGNNGVRIFAANTTGNVVQGNYIGTTSDGTGVLGNAVAGVGIDSSAAGNTVGGTASGAGNLISGNTQDGVEIDGDATSGNAILGNSISGNGNSTAPHNELGIDLVGTLAVNGVDANDSGDADTGPSNLQNFPVLTSAASSATTTTIAGTLNSEASKTYRLEFFSNDACDSSGNGEGKTFLGATSVTTDSSGNVSFTAPSLTGGVAGQVATATATDPDNNTSEFSACTTVVFDPTLPDTTPPTIPSTNAGPRFQKQRMFTVTWTTSTDTQTSPVRYDVRYRQAPYNGGFGGFVNWQTSITATTATFMGTPGTTYCFSARAVDGAGNASAYGAEGCTAVPVDNPAFKHRGKWGKKTGAGYYLNTFSRTKKRGATLTLPGVQAKALSIIVTKCRACGVINVFFKGKRVKRINLRSKAAARQKLRFINLRTFGSVQTGMVRVRVVSKGKLVIVEGLGVSAV